MGEKIKLKRLYLLNNNLSGEIPDSICTIYSINPNFRLYLHNNHLCQGIEGYPECLPDSHVGYQNTTECGD